MRTLRKESIPARISVAILRTVPPTPKRRNSSQTKMMVMTSRLSVTNQPIGVNVPTHAPMFVPVRVKKSINTRNCVRNTTAVIKRSSRESTIRSVTTVPIDFEKLMPS